MATKDKSVYVAHRYRTFLTGRTPTEWNSSGKVQKYQRTFTGVDVPKWREKIANHTQAGSSMSGVFESFSGSTLFTMRHENTIEEYSKVEGDFLGAQYAKPGSPGITSSAAEAKATMKAYKQIQEANTMMSGGTFLGELGESLRMLRSPAKGILDGLQSYLASLADWKRVNKIRDARTRKSEKRRAQKQAKKASEDRFKRAISQAWLEGSFGWLPLVADMQDAAKAYNMLATKNNEDRYTKIRAVGKADALVLSEMPTLAPVSDFRHQVHRKVWDEAVFVIRGEVRSRPKLTMMEKAEVFGLTPGQFLPTLWNLLPWSFLVDYFANIGEVLEASTVDVGGITWLVGTSIRTRNQYCTCRISHASGHNTRADGFVEGSSHALWKRRLVSRDADYHLQNPELIFKLPTSPLKQANMLALWTQANSVHPQRFDFFRGRTFRPAG